MSDLDYLGQMFFMSKPELIEQHPELYEEYQQLGAVEITFSEFVAYKLEKYEEEEE